jgi:CxxC motif-containing protein
VTRTLTCIVCPIGCALTVESASADPDSPVTVSGNRCKRGAAYAQEEVRAPKRVVTATCGIAAVGAAAEKALVTFSGVSRRVPVKTTGACPKERINELLADIYRTTVTLPVKSGDVVIADWRGTGIDVAAVRDLG